MQVSPSTTSVAQSTLDSVKAISQRIRALVLDNFLSTEAMKTLAKTGFHPSERLISREIEHCDLFQTLIMGLAWKQLSAAGHIALKQIFVHATQALNEAISDLKEGEQLALFVDLDDGTVESTPYFSGLTGSRNHMTPERSSTWWKAQAKRSYALCGAQDFLKQATSTGKVKICYLTSRSDPSLQADTITMLKAFDFPDVSQTSVKIAHRLKSKSDHIEDVSKTCQKAMFIGDKLGDSGINTSVSPEQLRETIRKETREHWGNDYFVVTNPVYGPSWEGITHTPYKATASQEQEKRQQTLQTWDDPELPCQTPPAALTQQMQQALLYMQSPSYDALTLQTCRRAGAEFEKQINDQNTSDKVVVIDIDGTAVNNSR
ncbi:MAG: HAD family acid phosphatase [Endozoicomonas sp.]|uniref:HAD family acid phosphatase n=1 Tax=Endozoicomonas sp. TaxID=1892382 RepID=UPI003D9BB85A